LREWPQKSKNTFTKIGIKKFERLEQAQKIKKNIALAGFGEKTEKNIVRRNCFFKKGKGEISFW